MRIDFFESCSNFFLRIFSISGRIRLRSLAAIVVIPVYFLMIPTSPFLGKRKMQLFVHFLCFALHSIIGEVYRQTFLSSKLQVIFLQGMQLFCFSFFYNTASSSSSVNCPSLRCSRPLMIFWWVCQWLQEGFRAHSWNVLPSLEVSLLGKQLYFCFWCAIPSADFIYCLPC